MNNMPSRVNPKEAKMSQDLITYKAFPPANPEIHLRNRHDIKEHLTLGHETFLHLTKRSVDNDKT